MKRFSTLLFVAIPFLLFSQEDKWTPEEIINTVYVSNPEFSKDGSKVVWTQRKGLEKEDKFVSHLYLARLECSRRELGRYRDLLAEDALRGDGAERMQMAKVVLVPFLIAVFLALITVRPMLWMQQKRVPAVLAVLLIVSLILAILAVVVKSLCTFR